MLIFFLQFNFYEDDILTLVLAYAYMNMHKYMG